MTAKKLAWWGIQLAWALGCALTLVDVLREAHWTDAEFRVLFVSTMLLLSFPSGYLVILAASKIGVNNLLGLNVIGDPILTWVLLVLSGWLQWFFIPPKIVLAFRSLRGKLQK